MTSTDFCLFSKFSQTWDWPTRDFRLHQQDSYLLLNCTSHWYILPLELFRNTPISAESGQAGPRYDSETLGSGTFRGMWHIRLSLECIQTTVDFSPSLTYVIQLLGRTAFKPRSVARPGKTMEGQPGESSTATFSGSRGTNSAKHQISTGKPMISRHGKGDYRAEPRPRFQHHQVQYGIGDTAPLPRKGGSGLPPGVGLPGKGQDVWVRPRHQHWEPLKADARLLSLRVPATTTPGCTACCAVRTTSTALIFKRTPRLKHGFRRILASPSNRPGLGIALPNTMHFPAEGYRLMGRTLQGCAFPVQDPHSRLALTVEAESCSCAFLRLSGKQQN